MSNVFNEVCRTCLSESQDLALIFDQIMVDDETVDINVILETCTSLQASKKILLSQVNYNKKVIIFS